MPELTADLVGDLAPYLTSWVERQVRYRRVPGAQVAVRVGQELVLSEAVGVADLRTGEPLRTGHLFRVASHSKWFTATAVLRLVDAGRLRLDDALGDLVGECADGPLAGVSVRELLGHNGGVIRDGVDSDFWQLEGGFPRREQLAALVAGHGRTFAPGEFFKYSNIGYGLLGQVVEEVTGQSYAEHLRAAVLRPLGLERTGPELDRDRLGEYAAGHSRPHGPEYARVTVEHVDTAALAAATGFYSTAEEMTRFGAAHLRGSTELLSDHAQRLMQRAESIITREGEETERYGLGMMHAQVGERRLVGHSGGYPGHITRTLLDPGDGLVVSVLTNAIDGPAEPLLTGVVKLVDRALADREDWQAEADRATLDRFTGRFASLWAVLDVVRMGDRLVLVRPEAADPADGLEELTVVDERTLKVKDGDGFGASGERVGFEFDDSGAVSRVRFTGMSHVPEDRLTARLGEHVGVR